MIQTITIVLDFDGTCVKNEFPRVGAEIGAIPVLKEITDRGHRIVLHTMRSDVEDPHGDDPNLIYVGGNYLSDAVNWFIKNEIPLYGIQVNPSQSTWTSSPKPWGEVIIDDQALGAPLKQDIPSEKPYLNWVEARKWLALRGVL
jgi:hypothetical protein